MPNIFTRIKKTAKRAAKATTKAAGKRYNVSYGRKGLKVGTNSIAKLAKDMMMIKSRLNVEKKFINSEVQQGFTAQVNSTVSGYTLHDITPLISQGIGENQRIGNSLKMTGFHMKIQLRGQKTCISARRMKCYIIKTTDTTRSIATQFVDTFEVNPLTGLVDYFSNKDYSDNKKVQKFVRTTPMYLKPVNIFGSESASPSVKDYSISLKLSDTWRYETNADNVPNDCKYYLVIVTDTGNHSTTTASTNPGVMVQDTFSGVEYQFHYKWWYVDN